MKLENIRGGEGVGTEKLKQFQADVLFLLERYRQRYVAREMGQDEGNLSKYLSGRMAVSLKFMHDFYEAWGKDLARPLKTEEKRGPYRTVQAIIADALADIKRGTDSMLQRQEALIRLLANHRRAGRRPVISRASVIGKVRKSDEGGTARREGLEGKSNGKPEGTGGRPGGKERAEQTGREDEKTGRKGDSQGKAGHL